MNDKIRSELKEFKEFKKSFKYEMKDTYFIDGKEYYDGICLINDDGRHVGDTDKFIDVGFRYKGDYAKCLSNLFNYEFYFRGFKLNSIESFFQGIKFIDKDVQKYIFNYSGIESNVIKCSTDYNWKDSGIVYFDGTGYDRYSQEYDDLVDELYISAIQNPLYRNLLKKVDKLIIHTMGDLEKCNTVFTRYEFERQLNALSLFLKNK